MKRKTMNLLIAAVFVITGSALTAQEKQDRKDTGKKNEIEAKRDDKALETFKEIYKRLDVGVRIYMDWIMQWGQKEGAFDRVVRGGDGDRTAAAGSSRTRSDYSSKNSNSFRINRAYLDVRYKITDFLKARVTTDVDGSVTPSGASNAAFHIYLKYAYLEAKKDFGPVMLSATGGMIETPVVSLTDKISDYRWISQNYLDQSKNILNGKSFDYSSDVGVKASIGLFKYATFTVAFTNGGGYKANESNSYKAITYLATVNPIKSVYISGFGRNEITAKYDYFGKKSKKEYYGYGVAYSTDLIKIGVNHIFPYETTVGTDYTSGSVVLNYTPVLRRGYMLIDAWFNFNLGALVEKAPLLITGRFVYGLSRGSNSVGSINFATPSVTQSTETGKQRTSLLYALGIGWKVNQNFRILVGGELQKYSVKKNRLLRYAESSTSGTDWHPAGPVYVGSRNPNDTRRVYVKAEVMF